MENKKTFRDRVEYFNDKGLLDRTDGPAVEYLKHDISRFLSNKINNIYGPGHKEWYINGKLHRTDGPTIEWSDGDKSWFLNGVLYTEKEHEDKLSGVDNYSTNISFIVR